MGDCEQGVQDGNQTPVVELLRQIKAGTAFTAEVEADLEEEGLIVQERGLPYATLTAKGEALLAGGEGRSVLVHLSVGLAEGDSRSADEVADRLVEFCSSLTVSPGDDGFMSVVCPLAEEVE